VASSALTGLCVDDVPLAPFDPTNTLPPATTGVPVKSPSWASKRQSELRLDTAALAGPAVEVLVLAGLAP
jgi:hypothetical protein